MELDSVDVDSEGKEIKIEFDDKRLYKIGDNTRAGKTISYIYHSSVNFIIFRTNDYSFGWEIEKISPWANDGLLECRRLLAISSSKLSLQRQEKFYSILASALANSLQSTNDKDTKCYFREVDEYICKYEGELKYRHSSGRNFEIYIKEDGFVNWYHRCIPPHLSKYIEEFFTLQSLSASVLPKKYRLAVSKMLGAALNSAFYKNENEISQDVFAHARTFINSQVDSFLKIKMLFVNVFSTITFLLFMTILSYFVTFDSLFLYGVSAGVIGAMVSVMQRNREIVFTPYAHGLGVYSECLSRLILGCVFGLLVIFLSKSELALASFNENLYAMVCFSFIAGFSERFVPDLMSTVVKKEHSGS